MSVTYKTIRERKINVDERRQANINRIYKEATDLIEAYKHSLELENESWTDVQGAERPYVMVGAMSEYAFEQKIPTSIKLSSDYRLHFVIATVIDDSPRGGDTALVNVELFIDGNQMTAHVEQGHKKIYIFDDDKKEFCDAIKDNVLMIINNVTLRK
ncbi:hypothetical protein KKJ17_19560 [Xenorhabdus bovienii]|uniref:Uncharacterized protein n=1 Tax=Xenorhabdus bovienii str. kraussei Quebec TaxID=1398203 RepID=A0A077PNC1_XENBV|nr:hypothetical protein [Xenorhabdus bovienii]MDE1491981.1 hypothetical protein [Xenorhabdus bovienii]MDE9495975.1 hypothetical protein [Xenorhabdus bovienii]MDE9504376.1 hypothetical protein [Xenorhabdus bovienii]MDE9519840.1 hypothetical protein [Xenorhabdus bovienii]MDE9528245.1 hypothetical protein [Xenorhabdus bovienii]